MNRRGASSTIVFVFGALAALAGLEHGVGAALQGSTAPPGLVFSSWPEAAFFRTVAGEPAMTLVPNLLASGLLTILVSLGLLLWSVLFPHRRGTGPVLLGLSVLLLMPGTMLLDSVFGLEHVETVVPVFILAAFATLGLSVFAALARDRTKGSAFRHP